MSVRQLALERLGAIRAKKQTLFDADEPNHLQSYYQRQTTKSSADRLTQRRIDAFLGLCASASNDQSTVSFQDIADGLRYVLARWHKAQEHARAGLTQILLKHVSHAAFSAMIILESNVDGGEAQRLHEFSESLVKTIGAQALDSPKKASPEVIVLIGFLEVAAKNPAAFSYSRFVVFTKSLSNLLEEIYREAPEPADKSYENLSEVLDASQNYLLKFQEQSGNFVLRWVEHTAAHIYSCKREDLWSTLCDPDRFESEDGNVVDDIVWSTVIDHVKIQYEVSMTLELSTNSEIILANTLQAFCIASTLSHEPNETLQLWIDNILLDIVDLDDFALGSSVVLVICALAVRIPSQLSDCVARLKDIIHHAPRSTNLHQQSLASVAAEHLLILLQRGPQDSLIGTVSNLANRLSGMPELESKSSLLGDPYNTRSDDIVSIYSKAEGNDRAALNAVEAVGVLGTKCQDPKISVLALNVLLQKLTRVSVPTKCKILVATASIALHCTDKDVFRVTDLCTKLEETENTVDVLNAINEARSSVAIQLASSNSIIWTPYLETLLRSGIQRARSSRDHNSMGSIFAPLASLLRDRSLHHEKVSFELIQLFHNFWFNLVLVGYLVNSPRVASELESLIVIARSSPSLALETLTDSFEADLESYPLLKHPHGHEETKRFQAALNVYVQGTTSKPRNFGEAVYMNALALLENLKCQGGLADGSLAYYRQPTIVQSGVGELLAEISTNSMTYFLASVQDPSKRIQLDRQLHHLLVGCCDQIPAVRRQASLIIDQIVASIPSAFCSSLAITTLLECLTLLGCACYEEYSDKYSPCYEFRSTRMELSITVSDSFKDRHDSLQTAQLLARKWLTRAMLESSSDVRTLLSSYITLTEDHTTGQPSDRGKLLAVEMAMKSSLRDQPVDQSDIRDSSDAFLGELTLRHLQATAGSQLPPESIVHITTRETRAKSESLYKRSQARKYIPFSDLREKLCSYVSRILTTDKYSSRLLRHLVEIPFNIFNIAAMRLATSLWARVVTDKPSLQADLLAEVAKCWHRSLKERRGLFSLAVNVDNPFSHVMEYAPTDKEGIAKEGKAAKTLLEPHLNILRFLSSRLAAPQSSSLEGQKILLRLLRITLSAMTKGQVSNHIFARDLRLRVLIMSIRLKSTLVGLGLARIRDQFATLLYDAALSMFASSPRWAFGSDVGQMKVDKQLINLFLVAIQSDALPGSSSMGAKTYLLKLLLELEVSRIDLWLNPMVQSRAGSLDTARISSCLKAAWKSNPSIAISLAQRFNSPGLQDSVRRMIIQRPWQCLKDQYAAEYILGSSLSKDARQAFKYLLYWTPVVPISATTYFLPAFSSHPLVLQFAMRSLESHPVEVTFFYVPQIVQVLRHDVLGYVRRFIIETAKLSQLFAHQIIWNFDANAFKDEDATIPDSIKPTLDSIKAAMMSNLSGSDKVFYETEFRFFGEVTSISGKLRPFIKKTKPEKKAKIDEEMALIKVEQGVYLPSNPDGEVVDIDRKSGRPLQSHAKAPFMATFMIRKSRQVEAAFEDDLQVDDNKNRQSVTQKCDVYEKKLSAIFKVGDDCRQDVLALQLISTFRSVFNSIGLDLYVFPYRVTATAPGCGVIDVLPNSISRDMLGREAVNGLYDYFVTTFGKPETVAFQQARMNFVKSLAAYSVITYLLQFKDRHNGNIMYDAQGHVLHIDFGFCFDIAPGGITFESAPFKLTTEMVAVMGGSTETQSYRMFQELCIKAFLVARQYAEQIIHLVTLMLDSGLPCFKGQTTITNLRNRFHLEVSEQQASTIMLQLISHSHLNQRTVAYDMFQKLTNGIPY